LPPGATPGGGLSIGFLGGAILGVKLAGQNPLFNRQDLIESSGVSFLGRVTGPQEGFDDLEGQFWADDPGTDAQDVHVIVFDPLASRVGVMAQAGANAWEFVGRHADSDP
jgi:hypothetical protein